MLNDEWNIIIQHSTFKITALGVFAMAVFIFLPRATRTGIIAPDLRRHFDRFLFDGYFTATTGFIAVAFIGGIILACRINFFLICAHLAVIGLFLASFFQLCMFLLYRNRRM